MEKTPILSSFPVSTYGIANPGFAGPAMSAAPYPGAPTAPPTAHYDVVPGYEGIGGGGFVPPPMPSAPLPTPGNGPVPPDWQVSQMTEEAAREAFVHYASEHCCYSSGPARDGVITKVEPFNTYRYRLETFAETRSTEWSQEPFTGQTVDAFIQPAPGPWDIPAQVPALFQDNTQNIRVPYTSSLKSCNVCMGMGRQPCKDCSGVGNKVCWVCNGAGVRQANDHCSHCNGRGRENCSGCHGNGSRECGTCRGKRQLLVFITLKVQWTNYKDDYVVEQASGLKAENLNSVSGREMFKDSQYMLYPLMGFPDATISQASQRLFQEHQTKYFKTSRILQQRHTIELIPISRVGYSWKGKCHTYYVFGNESKVYTDDYPATCCCSVM